MNALNSGMSRLKRGLGTPGRLALTVGGLMLVAVGAALFANVHLFDSGTGPASTSAPAAPGTKVAFAYLSQQHSNYCSLERSKVAGYANDKRLQGACCSAMNMSKYRYQVSNLRDYASIPEVPSDPYDIPVALAKQLFSYDASITLSTEQQAIYDRAMTLTDDKGPCCCHCWRWYMTRGLSKYLITQRNMDAAAVARVVDLVNGCGGPLESSAKGPSPPA